MTPARTVQVIAAVLLGACAGAQPPRTGPDQPPVVTLTFLTMNDFHGALDGVRDPDLAGEGGRLGGVETLASAVKALRAEAPGPVLLLDAGDCFQGPLPVNASEGKVCQRMFSLLGADAVGLGNHEFDYRDCGPDPPDREPEDPQCALKQALREAAVPVVAANVRDAETGDRALGLRPYVVLERGGVLVGVTGVVPRETALVSSPGGTRGLVFTDPVEEVRSVVPRMRAEGAGVVVVLAHVDGDCEGVGDRPPGDGLTTHCRLTGTLGRLVRAVRPGEVDVVVAGHSHVFIAGTVDGVAVVESLSQGRLLGRVEVAVDRRTGRVVPGGVRVRPPVPLCRAEDPASRLCNPRFPGFAGAWPPDPEALRFREEVEAAYLSACREVVGEAGADLPHGRGPETPLGDLTADLMREAPVVLGEEAADVAFVNQGSIRDGLSAGPITMCDLHRVWPFDDTLVEARMSGAQLREVFEFAVRDLHKWFAVSGISLRVHEPSGHVEVLDPSGRPLQDDRLYRVVTTSYLARGGARMDTFLGRLPPDRLRVLPFPSHRDAFREVLRRRAPLTPPTPGRVRIVRDAQLRRQFPQVFEQP